MKIVLILLIIIILVLLGYILKTLNKSILVTLLCSLVIINIVMTPKLCIDSALSGTSLFMNKVFPSLFPFLVISGLILSYDGVYIYSKLFGNILCKPLRLPKECTLVIIISMLCGYPLGAKYACELYENKTIDFSTFERLINIASNASPLFIIGAVGTVMLNNPYLGYLMLLSNYLSCFVIGIVIPNHKNRTMNHLQKKHKFNTNNFGNILKDCIESSIQTCLSIGGFVIIFSVIISIIKSNIIFDIAMNSVSQISSIPKNLIEGITLGTIEMTNGCYIISSSSTSLFYKFVIINFFLAFSGFSIVSQVHSFTCKYNVSALKYIGRKLVQGLIASAISILFFYVNIFNIASTTFGNNVKNSSTYLPIILQLLFLFPLVLYKTKKLFNVS